MKNKVLFGVVLLLLNTIGIRSTETANAVSQRDTITVCATPEMRSLIDNLVKEYGKLEPGQFFEVKTVNLSEFRDAITGSNRIGVLAQRPDVSMVSESMWRMTLGRNIAVTAMNDKNPLAENVDKTGISPQRIAAALSGNQPKNWGTLLGIENREPVHFYILNDPSIKLSISKFLEVSPSVLAEVESKSADELIETVKTDPFAVVFCQLATITDFDNQSISGNIKLVPLDRNGNERLDYNENIYGKLTDFERAIWIGKYPRTLISNVYAVAGNLPENENIIEFLSWVVTSGQQFVETNGYTELVYNEKQSHLNKLNPPVIFAEKGASGSSKAQLYLIITFAVLVLGTLITVLIRKKGKAIQLINNSAKHLKVLNENSLEIPDGLYYDKSHTWVFMEKDGTVKMGIDDFLHRVTGDYTALIMKSPGEIIVKNEPVLTLVQQGKKLNIYSPISGIIRESNEDLADYPSLLNNSVYSWGWMYAIEPANWMREISFLKMADSYKKWLKNEISRLKDFLAKTVNPENELAGQLVYQEGGEIIDHVLENLGPEVWEDFQKEIIDTADLN